MEFSDVMLKYGSDKPDMRYALEIKDGLTERAKKFRAAANKVSPYDLEIYFQRVDQNPDSYLID